MMFAERLHELQVKRNFERRLDDCPRSLIQITKVQKLFRK